MQKLRLAFLASHNGSSAQAIIKEIDQGKMQAEAVVIISNNSDAPVLTFGQRHNPPIPTHHTSSKQYGDEETADIALAQALEQYHTDLVILSGYMRKIGSHTLKKFHGRILNIHPALAESPYKGKGYFGDAIHKAVLANGDKYTGAMVHVVDEVYDNGTILDVTQVAVMPKDSIATLRKRVQKAEKRLYVQVVKDIIEGKIRLPILSEQG